MDISEGMLEVARKKLPDITFHKADIAEYVFPENIDVIFAFASLLHSDIDEVRRVLDSAYEALAPGGVFYISLKYMPKYTQKIKEDAYGRRLFYFYSPDKVRELATNRYETVFQDFQKIGDTEWFSLAFVKPC